LRRCEVSAKKRKPGRPRNERIHEIMRERKCSRTWAYVLWNRELNEENKLSDEKIE